MPEFEQDGMELVIAVLTGMRDRLDVVDRIAAKVASIEDHLILQERPKAATTQVDPQWLARQMERVNDLLRSVGTVTRCHTEEQVQLAIVAIQQVTNEQKALSYQVGAMNIRMKAIELTMSELKTENDRQAKGRDHTWKKLQDHVLKTLPARTADLITTSLADRIEERAHKSKSTDVIAIQRVANVAMIGSLK